MLRLREAGLPFIVVFTNPTTGGVTASYAMLGDVHIAEPGALICFAGPRVIEQTIREKLPKGFQRSEYLYEHGMVDMVVHRHNLRSTIGSLVGILTKSPARDELTATAPARAGHAGRRHRRATTWSARPRRRTRSKRRRLHRAANRVLEARHAAVRESRSPCPAPTPS